jgi:DNA-binding CsgD family transcriptional regulator
MRLDDEGLADIVKSFSRAAVDPAHWMTAMAQLQDAVGAVGVALELTDLETGAASMENTVQLDDDQLRRYEERIFHVNPRVRRALSLSLGAIADDNTLIDHASPSSREFLEWLRTTPYYYLIGAKVLNDDGKVGFLTANFSRRHGMATAEHHAVFGALTPHLVNVIAASRAVSTASLKGELITTQALNSDRAFALMDASGRLIECSAGFEALLQRQTMLRLQRRRLTASRPGDRAGVDRFLAGALGPSRHSEPPSPLRLLGPDSRWGLLLRAVPLAPNHDVFDVFRPAALLTLADLDQPHRVRRSELIALFGLTDREADVAALLGEGLSLDDAARRLEISDHTVRQHLKAVFGKVGVSRQAELVRIISRLA